MFLWWGPGLIQFYNDAYLPSFGVGKHPRAMGQPGRECWPEIWPIIGPQIEDVMKRGAPSWNEDQLVPILRNGKLEDVYWTYGYSPVYDESGAVAGTLVVCTETTSRVFAERRMGVLRALGDALSPTREPEDVPRLAEPVIRAAAADVPCAILATGSAPPTLIRLDASAASQILGQRLATHEAVPLQVGLKVEGTSEDITALFTVPIGHTGRVVFGLSPRLPFGLRYETFLRQVARQLADAEARARVESERRRLLEQAPVPAALMVGPDYVFEVANDLYCELVGRDVRGRAYYEAFPELVGGVMQEILSSVYDTGKPFVTNELCVPLARGKQGELEECYFKFNLSPIRLGDGRVGGMMVIAVEVTEQVVARKELQNAARAKDDFLATMSHELRTPLNALLGWTKLLKSHVRDPAKLEQGLAVIERNAKAQERLVSDLLDVSRIISGKLRLSIAPFDVRSVISAALDILRPAAELKRIKLETELAPDLGFTVGDADRIQQILWNLLSNAIRFTPLDGRVRIQVTRPEPWLRIQVVDSGEGIRGEHLANIFERFRQIDASRTRQHGGLGLGLAIVRYLAEAHGGSVSAHSEGLGKGATFEVLLPVHAVDTRREQELESGVSYAVPAPPPSAAVRLDGARVLAVDDHEDSLDLLCNLLEKAGAIVATASSAADALSHSGPFDVLISDIGMPSADGYELIRQFRAREIDGDVPAIALTAFARREDVVRSREAGFREHVAKPYDPDELLALVERLVSTRLEQ